MKNFKRIMALVIAMAMVFAMMTASFAATPDNPVTVSGLTEGDVAHFYKVIKWQNADATHAGGWVFAEGFTSLTSEDMDAITGDPKTGTPSALTADLAGKIARLAASAAEAGNDTVGSDGIAELPITGDQGKGSGLYLVLITPADADTVYNPVFVGADYTSDNASNTWEVVKSSSTYSDEAASKKSTLTVTKTASTTEDSWDDGKSDTTAVCDTVTFTVNTTIPGYGTVYQSSHFVMTDSLTDLALIESTVTVNPATYSAALADGTTTNLPTYSVVTSPSGYTITFAEGYLKTLSTPQDVTVTYDAKVTSDALKNVNTEKNEVQIEYSHDPSNESDYNVKKDTTQHYTFTIDANVLGNGSQQIGRSTSELVKVALSADGTPINKETKTTSQITASHSVESPLKDAVFGLYTDSACTTPYVPKNADGTAGTALTNITSDADGRLTISGLDAGTYYIKEISAPEGFIKDTEAHKIVIDAHMKEVTVTETINGKTVSYKTDVLDYYTVSVDDQPTATHTFSNPGTSTDVTWVEASSTELPSSLPNTRGVELPSTGGIGTTIFYVVGAILVIGAGVILITRRRMDA